MKLKVIIVDDETSARTVLRKRCFDHNDRIEIVEECNSVKSAVVAIKKHNPDIVFLDVDMKPENGFELFAYFDNIKFEIIFTTAHEKYAIQAIRSSALDFLLKPIGREDFAIALARFESNQLKKVSFDRFELLIENINNQFTDKHKIAFPTKNGFDIVQANSIVYCKADGEHTIVSTIGRDYYTTKSFKENIESLQKLSFVKVHRSYLINTNYVVSFKANSSQLELITGDLIPVAKGQLNKKELIDAITK
ncbi:DNA-binding response regulator [Flavobacterium collinsii]|nr:DNA-binding response regulator [Flavobacterium collinsii]